VENGRMKNAQKSLDVDGRIILKWASRNRSYELDSCGTG
jgi:hypothetical protein